MSTHKHSVTPLTLLADLMADLEDQALGARAEGDSYVRDIVDVKITLDDEAGNFRASAIVREMDVAFGGPCVYDYYTYAPDEGWYLLESKSEWSGARVDG